jgi:hypothetical protein
MVAIPATSMLEIRLDAMLHFSGSRVAALIWINPQHPSERFAAIDSAPQLAIGYCPAQTRQPDRRGGPRRSRADVAAEVRK